MIKIWISDTKAFGPNPTINKTFTAQMRIPIRRRGSNLVLESGTAAAIVSQPPSTEKGSLTAKFLLCGKQLRNFGYLALPGPGNCP